MSFIKREWNGRKLYSEDFIGEIESVFEVFKDRGDMTLHELEEACKEIVTELAEWVDELEDSLDEKNEKIQECMEQIEELTSEQGL